MAYFDPEGLDWLDNLTNISAGLGDTISFGITDFLRDGFGISDAVDKDTYSYGFGVAAGMLHGALSGGGGILKGGKALRAGTKHPIKRLFVDNRKWNSISKALWKGNANGMHAHHWLIRNSTGKKWGLSSIVNAQWNLVPVPAKLHMWMHNSGKLGNAFEYLLAAEMIGSMGSWIAGPVLLFMNSGEECY